MAQTLQKSKNNLHITLFFLFVFGLQSLAFAQIPLQQLQPFEVTFHPENQRNGQNFIRFNVSNQSEWQNFVRLPALDKYNQVQEEETNDPVYIGLYEGEWALMFDLNKIESDSIFSSSFSNETGKFINNLQVSIDLIVFSNVESVMPNVSTFYSFNDNELISVLGGEIDLNAIQVSENGSTSVSLQFTIDQIYFSESDKITIVLMHDKISDAYLSPLGLERIELTPGVDDAIEWMVTSSLMITEIMPRLVIDGTVTEYVEIYNPNPNPVDLKGFLLSTSDGKHAITDNVIIEPFSFVVLANYGLPENSPVNADYYFKNLSLPAHGSEISLRYRGSDIIRAFYDANIPGIAWELNNPADAFDGYAGIHQFIPSESTLDERLNGSPGISGFTDRYFVNNFRQSSWQLISVPGVLTEKPNVSGQRVEFHSVTASSHEQLTSNEIKPHTPYLAQSGILSSRLFAKEQVTDRVQMFHTSSYSVIPNPYPLEIYLNQFRTPDNRSVSRSALLWDSVNSSFVFSDLTAHAIPAWTSVLIPNSSYNYLNITDADVSNNNHTESRFINLKLTGVNSTNDIIQDESTMIFFRGTEADVNNSKNYPKLWPLNIFDVDKASLIYLIPRNGKFNSLNASENFSLNPEQEIFIDLGIINYQFEGSFTLSWATIENIPNDWELQLIDNNTDSITNMHEKSFYQFQEERTSINDSEVPKIPGIYALNVADENPRFTIIILSTNAVRNDKIRVSEIPETVELYQNYPNPFNPSTNISFYLPEQRMASVSIYNVVGQRVGILLQDNLAAGEHTLVWDASDMPSGIYIIHLEIGNRVYTRKMTLIK